MAIINAFYDILNRLGYHHPIHPTEVHMPIGLVVGAFVFAVFALVFRRRKFVLTPRHCIILAFIWIFPTMILGIMDWQHFYGGAWILPIKVKLSTAPILATLLGLSVFLGRMYGATSLKVLPVYFLCLCAVTILGYFGGQLTYAGRTIRGPEKYKAGEQIFAADCTTCHPSGGNTIDPGKPILHSPLLESLDIFKMWLRNPAQPMPPFPSSKISDAQAKELYAYIMNVLEQPKKE
jgi:uncharacterized membrane protein